jgi:hypothetical protein
MDDAKDTTSLITGTARPPRARGNGPSGTVGMGTGAVGARVARSSPARAAAVSAVSPESARLDATSAEPMGTRRAATERELRPDEHTTMQDEPAQRDQRADRSASVE